MQVIINTTKSKGRKVVKVASVREAVQVWESHRDATGIGFSAMRKCCGDILVGGVAKYRVSYNGRVWEHNENIMLSCPKFWT